MTLGDIHDGALRRVLEDFARIRDKVPEADEEQSTATFRLVELPDQVTSVHVMICSQFVDGPRPDGPGFITVSVAAVRRELVRRSDA